MNDLTWSPVFLTEGITTESNSVTTNAEGGQSGASTNQKAPMNHSFLFMMVIFMLVLYFFMIRPQSKKQKELQRMLSSLEKGDRVMTTGGIYGTVDTVKENSFILKLGDNVKVEFAKYAVTQVIEKKNPPPVVEKKPLFSFRSKKKAEGEKSSAENKDV